MKATDKADSNKENGIKFIKPPSPSGCKIGVNPQQTEFEFDELTLDSCFDSGNMSSAVKASDSHVFFK